MKLYNYKQFINESIQSKEEIDSICKKYDITNYTINDDGTVDVFGNVLLGYRNFTKRNFTKLPLKFGKVSGDFYCYFNQLTSLEGSPSEVGGYFYCDNNQLTSLEGCPTKVGGGFYCNNNKLTSLEGSPIKVGGDFYCANNLEGCSKEDVIRGNKIVLQALELVYDELGLEVPDEIYIEGYEII